MACFLSAFSSLQFFGLSSPLSRCNASVLDETEEHLDFVMGEVSIGLNNAARKALS